MKYLISVILTLVCAIIIFAYGFKAGKTTAEKENDVKVIKATENMKDDTEGLKKEIYELKKKIKEVKNEECNYILTYPVRTRCLQER